MTERIRVSPVARCVAGVRLGLTVALAAMLWPVPALVTGLPDTIQRVEPSIVVVGTMAPLRRPQGNFRGTGFAVGDGRHVLTNAHVVPSQDELGENERLTVFARREGRVEPRRAVMAADDPTHDLALLRIEGEALPAMRLGASERVRAGERYAFTGFPIGMVLGLYPVTHEALVSSITPIAIPQGRADRLDPTLIRRLSAPYDVFQLDATAYPGNSGSPLYEPSTGTVVGVINMVFVKQTKENLLKDPSGIAYAIPIEHGRRLLQDGPGADQ